MGFSVLVVEDEVFVALEIAQILTAAGHHVVGPAGSVTEALELLKGAQPDAAVLDVNLNGERVTAVARHLRGIGVPFIFASAYTQEAINLDPGLVGGHNIGKPIVAARLVREVEGLLGPSAR